VNPPLLTLGRLLRESGYDFTTITPLSHRRVNARPENAVARSLRDVFGWSRPFPRTLLPAQMLELLREAGELIDEGELLRSGVRFSTRGAMLFVHSAFPTTGADAVFFGPDTYRYLSLLEWLAPAARRAVDIGCGSGAGGLFIANACDSVVLTDINDVALRYARINAALNGVENVELVSSDVLRNVAGDVDLIIANPPYLVDDDARLYRDGRGTFGEWLSLEIVRQSVERLTSGGRLILYTASAIVDGVDTFHKAVEPLLTEKIAQSRYKELDPDVFNEELDRDVYRSAERIAVVALDVTMR
jgi:methylase of polypeptide subunit release factors